MCCICDPGVIWLIDEYNYRYKLPGVPAFLLVSCRVFMRELSSLHIFRYAVVCQLDSLRWRQAFFSAVQWELGLAHSAPGRSGCSTSSASGDLCAGVGGCALRACHIQSEWGLCFAGYGLDHFDWSVVGCLRFLRVGSAGGPADRYLFTSQHSVVSCMPRSLNGGLL